ncbi:MAG TPA: hypothetical protein VJ761_16575 [Ktedonobacteraceae bacterium]|nr:hypothetical protein [Ktedonobacteraceae bacterium]
MAPLRITSKLHVTPLIDIESSTFAERYVSGVYWRLFGWQRHGEIEAQGPLPEDYLIDNLKMCAQINRFDGHHDEALRADLGFFLGMLHGGVLTPAGMLRPDAHTLVILHTQDFREGYERGRRDYFTCYEQIIHSEDELLDLLTGHAEDHCTWAESKTPCTGRLAVRLGNSPDGCSRSPKRNSALCMLCRTSSQ